MAIKCEFIDFIIPIANIDRVYEGGFEKYKSDKAILFNGHCWNDEFLFRDGAMNWLDIQFLIEKWEKLGLKGTVKTTGQMKWKDFCVVESLRGGPSLPCDWLGFDPETRSAFYKDRPEGEIIGR
jgi:hypothetical protein